MKMDKYSMNLNLTSLCEDDLDQINILFCYGNKLTEIPLYTKLKELYCSNNSLTKLPVIPTLKLLYCNNNIITEIPNLQKLRDLSICDNQISEIPLLPDLRYIRCDNNPNLTKIPELPNLTELYCSNNPVLKVPYLKKLSSWLDCDGCTYFQNAGITDSISYHNFLHKVDVIVLLLIHSNKVKNFLSIDLIRELWNNYIN
jgi:Leucine-rich repeat (LRR) protein